MFLENTNRLTATYSLIDPVGMSASPAKFLTDNEFDHADALVVGWELTSHQDISFIVFSQEVAKGLSRLSGATTKVSLLDHRHATYLASSNDNLVSRLVQQLDLSGIDDFAPVEIPMECDSETLSGVSICQRLHADVVLVVSLEWSVTMSDIASTWCSRKTTTQLARAACELITKVYLRQHLTLSKTDVASNRDREEWIAALYQGADLRRSFHQIARLVASRLDADRVSLVRLDDKRARLVATSSDHHIDRRAQLSRSIEQLAVAYRHSNSPIDIVVESDQPTLDAPSDALHQYLLESGAQRIQAAAVYDETNDHAPVAFIVKEWFTASEPMNDDLLDVHVPAAIREAIRRDKPSWLGQAMDVSRSRFAAVILLSLLAVSLVLAFFPAPFTLPVDGRMIPAVHRRIFAPASAVVTRIAVRNGQVIKQGDELFDLRSTVIDLQEEQVRGDLLTAKTRLASLTASKTNVRRATNTDQESLSISTSEEPLKVEIAGLEKQLALIAEQKRELIIRSPIDGVLDRWDLEQSLFMRPVAQGQFLADVYSANHSWIVELDIPDAQTAYLRGMQGTVETVTFRLQSRADQSFQASVVEIAESAGLDAQGKSVVRMKCLFNSAQIDDFSIGATVWADVDCGTRAIGFVLFRGLIEWFGRQSWY